MCVAVGIPEDFYGPMQMRDFHKRLNMIADEKSMIDNDKIHVQDGYMHTVHCRVRKK